MIKITMQGVIDLKISNFLFDFRFKGLYNPHIQWMNYISTV